MVILVGRPYYGRRIQSKICRGNRCVMKILEETRQKPPGVFSGVTQDGLHFPSNEL